MTTQLKQSSGLRSQVFGDVAFVGSKRAAPAQQRKQLQVDGHDLLNPKREI